MARNEPPPGSLLVAVLGGFAGAAAGLAVYALLWLLGHPGASAGEAVRQTLGAGLWRGPVAPFAAAGALAGFLLAGALVGNRLVAFIGAAVGRALGLLLGGAVGTAVGALVFVAAWVVNVPDGPVEDRALEAMEALAARDPSGAPFLLAGLVAGLVSASVLVTRGSLRSGVRVAAGAFLGSVAGLVIYSVAYVLLLYPTRPDSLGYALHFAEAAYSFAPVQFLLMILGAASGVLLSRYSWRLYGILTFLSLLSVVLGYALYTLTTSLPSVPPGERPLSYFLFAAELSSLAMVLLYSFYTIDVAARKHWRRDPRDAPFSPFYLPKVAFHVPTFNEPPELVEATLRSLLSMDYPVDRYVILVGDDSTRPECAEPLRAFCQGHGITYVHRDDRRGYKAGALNELLRRTPADATLVAVIDADYQVEPDYLRDTVGYFIEPGLGWLQTPQDYRNQHQSFLTEQYYLADAYFYRTILPSRNEENSIIFCGTMGILRKRAVREAGGWGEQYITEDAELSVRLLNAGWSSLYLTKTYGRGLIPPTFEGYQKQHYRWAFGGGRILRGHGLRFLFGRFTFRQRLDYLVGTLNWFEGVFLFAIAAAVLGMGIAELAGLPITTHHGHEILLIGLVPVFLLLDGLTRVHLVLRRSIHLGFGGTLRILGMWFSVKFSNMRGALKALLGFSIPFLRTRKVPAERMGRWAAARHAVRLTRLESTMAFLLLATSLGVAGKALLAGGGAGPTASAFLAAWLFYYAIVFTAAPLYAYKSFVTLRPGPPAAAPPPGPAPPPPAVTFQETPRPPAVTFLERDASAFSQGPAFLDNCPECRKEHEVRFVESSPPASAPVLVFRPHSPLAQDFRPAAGAPHGGENR